MMLDVDSLQTQTFCGIRLTQSWYDLMIWEHVLNTEHVGSIAEIGTWEGGMSCFLAFQAQARGARFTTFDIQPPLRLVSGFTHVDVFSDPGRVLASLTPGPGIVFCDGGDKPREMQTFAPRLNPGDMLAVHDWGDEAVSEDVPECLTPIHEDLCEEVSSHTRFYRRSLA